MHGLRQRRRGAAAGAAGWRGRLTRTIASPQLLEEAERAEWRPPARPMHPRRRWRVGRSSSELAGRLRPPARDHNGDHAAGNRALRRWRRPAHRPASSYATTTAGGGPATHDHAAHRQSPPAGRPGRCSSLPVLPAVGRVGGGGGGGGGPRSGPCSSTPCSVTCGSCTPSSPTRVAGAGCTPAAAALGECH